MEWSGMCDASLLLLRMSRRRAAAMEWTIARDASYDRAPPPTTRDTTRGHRRRGPVLPRVIHVHCIASHHITSHCIALHRITRDTLRKVHRRRVPVPRVVLGRGARRVGHVGAADRRLLLRRRVREPADRLRLAGRARGRSRDDGVSHTDLASYARRRNETVRSTPPPVPPPPPPRSRRTASSRARTARRRS